MTENRLEAALNGRQDNYLLPFFWQHGAKEEVLRDVMARICEAGAKAVCVESRPHPDFAGPEWFRDMDIIMEEAKNRGMRVWLLDDKSFPTGYAAGLIESKYPQHRRLFVTHHAVDAIGPMKGASFLIQALIRDKLDKVVSVTASRRTGDGLALTGDMIDLTGCLKDGRVYWDVPEGLWTVVFIYTAHKRPGSEEKSLNPISPEAVDVLIEGVYQPHYERYKAEFGNTFAGFFSDEPQFDNVLSFEAMVGRLDMHLPWTDELGERMKRALGADALRFLPCLWFNGGAETARVRYAYMDALTGLYRDSFCNKLAGWCHARGVEYIGHVVEDNNCHSRLGLGNGHYFRSLWGQDMAGVDIVMHQIHPGYDAGPYRWHGFNKTLDGEFFHYALVKMASSLGHIDPKKQGRTLCENFGAYGWSEGLRLMKWLADHAIVRGVNYMTPHAFNDRDFPDPDGPPHFYARGHNPQYRFTKRLFQYINRLCHLFSGGVHVAPAAVLYHAEAEWWGGAMLMQRPMKALMQRQIDCDVLPCDIFRDGMNVEQGRLLVNRERYSCLVVPYAEALPGYFLNALADARSHGLPVFFMDGYPSCDSDGKPLEQPWRLGEIIAADALAERLICDGLTELTVSCPCQYLRVYHYRHEDMELFLFFNEDPACDADVDVELPVVGPLCAYDAMDNALYRIEYTAYHDRCTAKIRLSPDQSVVIVAGKPAALAENVDPCALRGGYCSFKIDGKWTVSTATCEEYPVFTFYKSLQELVNINAPDELPEFSGTVRYESCFECDNIDGNTVLLDLGQVFETAEVWINGHAMGARICRPYVFDITGAVRPGRNGIIVEVTNTLAKQVPDYCSVFAVQEPGGLIGGVTILRQR